MKLLIPVLVLGVLGFAWIQAQIRVLEAIARTHGVVLVHEAEEIRKLKEATK